MAPLGLDALLNPSLDLSVDARGCRAPLVGVMEVGRGSRVETASVVMRVMFFRCFNYFLIGILIRNTT